MCPLTSSAYLQQINSIPITKQAPCALHTYMKVFRCYVPIHLHVLQGGDPLSTLFLRLCVDLLNFLQILNQVTYENKRYLSSMFNGVIIIFFSYGTLTRFRVMASPYGASRSHSVDTPHSVWLLSSTQRPLPDNTQHSKEANSHAIGGIRTRNHKKRTAADPRLRPCCHWYRWVIIITQNN